MARPSDLNSKTLSVRVPMEFYLGFLNEAFSRNMSVSEFMTMKVMTNAEALTKEVERLEDDNASIQTKLDNALSEINSLKASNKALEASNKNLEASKASSEGKASLEVKKLRKQLDEQDENILKAITEVERLDALRISLGQRLYEANKFAKSKGAAKDF